MRLGVHVPIAGGLLEAVARAKRLDCTTMQIFSRSPRGGPAPKWPAELLERFDAERRAAGIEPLAIHGPYIINLASPDAFTWKRSVALYRDEYARATALKADYLVTHVGSHRGEGEEAGMRRVADAVSRTLDGLESGVTILLENTAGSGQGLGYRFEQLAEIREAVTDRRRVGVCLDTAHLFAAGYAIHTGAGLDDAVASFDRTVGLKHLKLIHLNDSKAPFDSRVDRHWHVGQGHIGLDAFKRLVNHPALKDVPCILETPKSAEADDHRNLSTVRKLAHGAKSARRLNTVCV
ncbi:MAG: deoxyribonuclease IV [Candidatus Omnitrophica bacterium]|nr:deoxyribonuclease IV [Candidatus Omnitrophota bacterium]